VGVDRPAPTQKSASFESWFWRMPGKLGFDVAGFQLDITKSAEIDAVVECIKNKLAPDLVYPAPQSEAEAATITKRARRKAGAIPSVSHAGHSPCSGNSGSSAGKGRLSGNAAAPIRP
jgi:hypothetical protein